MNKHIEKYLENYLKSDKPEFAVLLNGKWGSGKTYFINQIIDKYESDVENKNIKFIKISFFEISNKNDLQHKIVMKLLGIKDDKGWFDNGTKVGVSIINSFGKKLGLSIYDIPIEEILNKINKKIVFIFDDLERTNISLHEVLGYINNYVEILKFNVIILANELEINDKKYQKFKEKVIGKTFEVQHDFEKVLSSFTASDLEKYISDNKKLIQTIYNNANYNNLRHIKQTLLDFTYFINLIDEKYLKNEEFMSKLIKYFFIFSIEVKGSKLYEKENLFYYKDDIDCDKEVKECNEEKDKCKNQLKKCEREEINKFYKKHDIPNKSEMLFRENVWIKIIFKTSINKEEINELIKELSIFLVEKEEREEVPKRPSWIDLWYYRELEDNQFEEILKDVVNKFNSCSYETPSHFLHVIALLISFVKKGLCDLSLINIEKQVNICIEKYSETSPWKEELFGDSMSSYSAGLEYMDNNNEEFGKLYQLIIDENEKIYYANQGVIEKNKLEELFIAIKDNDEEVIKELLLNKYKEKPVLKNVSTIEFLQLFKNIDNTNLTKFRYILNARYPDNHYINNRQKIYCYYLKEELGFWKEIDKELKIYIEQNKNKTLHSVLLKEFHEFTVKNIVKKLVNCDKNS